MSKSRTAEWRKWPGMERQELVHAVRTTIAAVISLLLARLIRLPESYWSPITTMIVMQSTLGAALTVSKHRLAGTAMGAITGALLATFIGTNAPVCGTGVFLCGIICAMLQVERTAFRYAGITLTIILLISHSRSVWVIAVHRFIEISLGIAVGLFMTVVWPEPPVAAG